MEKQERFEGGITHKALNRCKLIVEVLGNILAPRWSPQSPADGSRSDTKCRQEPKVMGKAKLPLGQHQVPMHRVTTACCGLCLYPTGTRAAGKTHPGLGESIHQQNLPETGDCQGV